MTEPAYLRCKCGHPKARHEAAGIAPQCSGEACSCLSYRPETAPVQQPVPTGGPAPVRRNLIDEGKASGNKSIVALANRIAAQLTELGKRLREDDGKAAARQRVADLERQLVEARAALKGTPTAPREAREPRPPSGLVLPCPEPDCDRSFDSNQGVVAHRRRAHEGFNPRGGA